MGLHCQLNLTNTTNKPFYYPGETLSGNVVVTTDSDKKVKGVKLRISGKGNVKFTVREPARDQTLNVSTSSLHHRHSSSSTSSTSDFVDVEYRDEETYLDVTLNLFGYGGADWTIKSGRSIYPFQFILPLGLPSSFDGEHGSIEYSLDAVIGQSWAFDYKAHAKFPVVGVVDLNNEPTAQVPVVVKACKTFGVIFQSGPLDVTLRIPRGGGVPGEYVPFTAEIFNKSDKTVTEYLSIQQEIEFFAGGKSKTQNKTVVEILGEALKPGADHMWQDNILRIPQVPVSSFRTCRLIKIQYTLVLEMKVSGLGFNLKASSPFVIGNIPFRGVPYQQTLSECQYNDPPPPYTEKPLSTKSSSNDDDFELL